MEGEDSKGVGIGSIKYNLFSNTSSVFEHQAIEDKTKVIEDNTEHKINKLLPAGLVNWFLSFKVLFA